MSRQISLYFKCAQQKNEGTEVRYMNKLKFEETNTKVLNGFWTGVGIGIVIGGAIAIT
ncbi:hypothetical protein [Candidatus Enterococcus mansonii]|uniref:Uncharacterized protein n=1 Tax=Candidatus Enterococcus mansonii TaxID=1834181 RepID=A0A242CEL1_9ENTE|nr:hypothetical protein A5880_001646 [Enterococcus sp. 4G2_DIV0659]